MDESEREPWETSFEVITFEKHVPLSKVLLITGPSSWSIRFP